LQKLRRRYESAGAEQKRKLLDQAQELLGDHRKTAIQALRVPPVLRGPRIITGRPVMYEPGWLQPWMRRITAKLNELLSGRDFVRPPLALSPGMKPTYPSTGQCFVPATTVSADFGPSLRVP
jgi:hypothetical protein